MLLRFKRALDKADVVYELGDIFEGMDFPAEEVQQRGRLVGVKHPGDRWMRWDARPSKWVWNGGDEPLAHGRFVPTANRTFDTLPISGVVLN